MAAPPRTTSQELPRQPGAGTDLVHIRSAPDETFRLWIEGDAFPRLVLDPSNAATGQILVGDGTVAPTPLGGGVGGGASTADPFITYAAAGDLSAAITTATMIRRGTIGALPAAGHAGFVYIATDTNQVLRDNGATWDTLVISPGGAAGGDLSGSFPNPAISVGVVTNAKLAAMATARIKGRVTAGPGDPEDLTAAQVKTMLAIASGDVSGLGTFATLNNPLTVDGDLLTRAGGVLARIAVGADTRVLTVVGGVPAWAVSSSGLSLTATALKTAAYPAAANDFIPCDLATTGSFAIALPSAPPDKTVVAAEVVLTSGTRTLTINRGGTDHFDSVAGATSKTLRNVGDTWWGMYVAATGVWLTLVQPSLSQIQLDINSVAVGTRGEISYDSSSTASSTITDDGTRLHVQTRVVKFGGIMTWSHSFSQQDGAEGTVGAMDNYINHIAAALNVPFTECKLRGRSGAQASAPNLGEPTQVPGKTPAQLVNRSEVCGTTAASATVTDAAILATDVGREVGGSGIPPGTTIVSVVPATSFVMTANARFTNAANTLSIGGQQGLGAVARHLLPPHVNKRAGHAEPHSTTEADPALNICLLGINDPLRDFAVAGTIGVNAYKHGLRTFAAIRRLQSLYFADDASIVYGGAGAWTTPTSPTVFKGLFKRNPTAGATATITIPDTIPVDANGNGVLDVFLYGQGNGSVSNYSTTLETRIDWTGTFSGSGSVTRIGGQGTGETGIQMVQRFAITAADRGKTIIGTLAGQTHSDSFDVLGWGFEDVISPPAVILVNTIEQGGASLGNFFSGVNVALFNNALAAVAAEFDASVVVADVKTTFANLFNFTVSTGHAIAADPTVNHAAQTVWITPVNAATNLLAVGAVLRFGVQGVLTEEMLVTAIDKTDAGSFSGFWKLTVTRNYTGADVGDAGTFSSNIASAVGDLVVNTRWLCPDRVHPSPYGHRLLAGTILAAIGTLSQTDSQVAGGGGYSRSVDPSIPDTCSVWVPGTHATLATAIGAPNVRDTLVAERVYVPEDAIATGIQWEITLAAGAGCVGRVGLYTDSNGLPGDLLAEGDATIANDGATGIRTATMFKLLRKGYYWIAYVPQGAANVGTLRITHTVAYAPCIGVTSNAPPLGGNQWDVNGIKIPGVTGALPSPFGNVAGQAPVYQVQQAASPFGAVPALVLQLSKWVQD